MESKDGIEPEHKEIVASKRTPSHYFGGLVMLILLAISLFGMYRFFRNRRRSRPGFISSSSSKPSFLNSLSKLFGLNSIDSNSIYNPVNSGFEDDDEIFSSGGFSSGLNIGLISLVLIT